jgi:23S rRNA (guanine2445-N2)-methyltransferase / 23S rRNA (guanine2069-N7)-methyltransferase
MGTVVDGLKACLWSRVGSRVLLQLGRFDATSPEELYAGMRRIPWADHIDVRGTIWVDFAGRSKGIRNAQFGAQKSKDAIVDSLRDTTGDRPDVDREDPDIRINVHLRHGGVIVSLDLAGDGLHRRTPNRRMTEAPLRETLAAALLLTADWPRRLRAGETFYDPFCGSGTLAIEARGIATDQAPGLTRGSWGFFGWKGFDHADWAELKAQAREQHQASLAKANQIPRVFASDIDPSAVAVARLNAKAAGVTGIDFSQADALLAPAPRTPPGVLVSNPPYGERLGTPEEIGQFYRHIGDAFRHRLLGWDAYVFVPADKRARQFGLKPQTRWEMRNANIDCCLLHLPISENAPVPKPN